MGGRQFQYRPCASCMTLDKLLRNSVPLFFIGGKTQNCTTPHRDAV